MADDRSGADFAALARQYWAAWGDALRDAGGASPAVEGYRDALDSWVQAAAGGSAAFGGVLESVNRQGKAWLAQMQQVAAQFAGRDHSAQDIAGAWRNALGPAGNPFADLFGSMEGTGMLALAQWQGAVQPLLQGMRAEASGMLGLPAFGFTREHQERLQALGQAQLRWQEAFARYNLLMADTGQAAFAIFESRLAEREEPSRQLTSVRALFDLWVDAAEEAYAKTALSAEYRHAYGELVNAQMQLRASQQAIMEQAASAMGLPGRTELDGAYRRLADLERQLRRLQRQGEAAAPASSAPTPAAAAPEPLKAKPAASGPAPAKPAPATGTAAKAARKPAAKPAVNKAMAKKAAANEAAGRKR